MITDTALETCILCGANTSVKVSTPIENRYGYVEGAGQCCNHCYLKVVAETYRPPITPSNGDS